MTRWVGDAAKVQATAKTVVKTRTHGETSEPVAVQIPDHLDIIAQMANGAQAHFVISEVTGRHRQPAIERNDNHLYYVPCASAACLLVVPQQQLSRATMLTARQHVDPVTQQVRIICCRDLDIPLQCVLSCHASGSGPASG